MFELINNNEHFPITPNNVGTNRPIVSDKHLCSCQSVSVILLAVCVLIIIMDRDMRLQLACLAVAVVINKPRHRRWWLR